MIPVPVTLKTDFNSAVWRAVAEHIEARISELRELNDTRGLPVEPTEQIRGGIAELRALLRAAQPVPGIQPRADIYHRYERDK